MMRTDTKLRFGLTPAGTMVLRGTGFVLLAALVVPAFGVLATLVSVVLLALIVGFVLRPKIRIDGNLPDRVIAGQTVHVTYRLQNVARLPAYSLCVRFTGVPEAIEQVADGYVLPRLDPGETAEVSVAIRARRRGYYQIGTPLCESSFPFNLFCFGSSRGTRERLVVLPTFSWVDMPSGRMDRHAQAVGSRLAGLKGVSPEYVGNRPFLPGDSPRHIDARAWARLSVPATKEYDDDCDNHAALVLDTRLPKALLRANCEEIVELEAAVSLCASVAFTINNDCLIDLLLAGPDAHQFTAWPRTARLDKIHEILAGVTPSAGYSLERMAPLLVDRFHEISQVIFVLMNWTDQYGQLLEMAARAGCRTRVFVVGDTDASRAHVDDWSWATDVHFVDAEAILTKQTDRL